MVNENTAKNMPKNTPLSVSVIHGVIFPVILGVICGTIHHVFRNIFFDLFSVHSIQDELHTSNLAIPATYNPCISGYCFLVYGVPFRYIL